MSIVTPSTLHLETARGLNLSDIEAQAFVKEQLALERDERASEREAKQKALELQLEIAKANKDKGHTPSVGKIPRLPPYQEGDDIEAFFLRLDRFGSDYKWSDETKLHQLLSLLSGKALTIYHQLEEADRATYKELKGALLKAYGLTTEECRMKFRDIRIKPQETPVQFAARLRASFRKYWESDGAPQTLEGLLDLIHREAFTKSLPTDLVANLNQRKLKNLDGMKVEADAWFDAHGHPCKLRTGNKPRQLQPSAPAKLQAVNPTATQPDRRVKDFHSPPHRSAQQGNSQWKQNSRRWHCNRCRTDDHAYYQCPKVTAAAAIVQEGSKFSAGDEPSPAETSRPRWRGGRQRETAKQNAASSNASAQ